MAQRTLLALATSLQVGLFAAALSTTLAVVLGLAATAHRSLDRLVGVITEMALGLPHFVLIIMVAYAAGGGLRGIILGVGLTHWPRLARLLRHEAQSVAASEYVRVSRALGRGPLWIARHHLAPHLLPQVIAGFVLIFPHAILHEAGLSFIGLGLPPHLPSIGVILSESLRAILAGQWWLALFPGLGLMLVALAFERFG
jgi:peptide/nickel transport system permease protein